MASKLHLETALTPDGWRHDVVVHIDHGVITGLEPAGRDATAGRLAGVAVSPVQPTHLCGSRSPVRVPSARLTCN